MLLVDLGHGAILLSLELVTRGGKEGILIVGWLGLFCEELMVELSTQ